MAASIIFDLDGTLVDSSLGIIEGLSFAFEALELNPNYPLTPEIIGPPLREILRRLSPNTDEIILDKLADLFKRYYDTSGFQQTQPFRNVEKMLQSLATDKIALYLATNKRQQPTAQILDTLGWSCLFDRVISPDTFSPPLAGKAAILAHLIKDSNLSAQDCLYIGDRLDDYKAAKEIGIPFALAEWGFEGDVSAFSQDVIRLHSPDASYIMLQLTDRVRI